MTTDGHPYQHDAGLANERTLGILITGGRGHFRAVRGR